MGGFDVHLYVVPYKMNVTKLIPSDPISEVQIHAILNEHALLTECNVEVDVYVKMRPRLGNYSNG